MKISQIDNDKNYNPSEPNCQIVESHNDPSEHNCQKVKNNNDPSEQNCQKHKNNDVYVRGDYVTSPHGAKSSRFFLGVWINNFN